MTALRPIHLFLLATAALALLEPPREACALIGGSPATGFEYQAVGSIVSADSGRAFCTATLIAPRWIALAEHCREGGSEDEPILRAPAEMEFRIGPDAQATATRAALARWIAPPSAPNLGENARLDVAFAELERAVSPDEAKPISIATLGGTPPFDAEYEVVGFGVTSTVGFGEEPRFRKAARVALVGSSGNALLRFFGNADGFRSALAGAFPGEEAAWQRHLESASVVERYGAHVWDPRGRDRGGFREPEGGWADTCFADSGGPLLMAGESGPRLVGIVQSGFRGETMGCVPLGTIVGTFGPALEATLRRERIPHSER